MIFSFCQCVLFWVTLCLLIVPSYVFFLLLGKFFFNERATVVFIKDEGSPTVTDIYISRGIPVRGVASSKKCYVLQVPWCTSHTSFMRFSCCVQTPQHQFETQALSDVCLKLLPHEPQRKKSKLIFIYYINCVVIKGAVHVLGGWNNQKREEKHPSWLNKQNKWIVLKRT